MKPSYWRPVPAIPQKVYCQKCGKYERISRKNAFYEIVRTSCWGCGRAITLRFDKKSYVWKEGCEKNE